MYLPESFEWIILKSGVLDSKEVEEILLQPENLIESAEFFSWERYFTTYLVQITRGTFLQYNKRQLNPNYLQKKIAEKILPVMQGVELQE